jgi:hypothetical protein
VPKIGPFTTAVFAAMLAAVVVLAVVRPWETDEPVEQKSVAKEFGVSGPAVRIAAPALAVQGMRFAAFREGKIPCIAFRVPGSGGGRCFQGLGTNLSGSFEVGPLQSGKVWVMLGAAVPEARAIRIGGEFRPPLTISTGRLISGLRLRFFAAAVPEGAFNAKPKDVVALDASGRVLSHEFGYYRRVGQ